MDPNYLACDMTQKMSLASSLASSTAPTLPQTICSQTLESNTRDYCSKDRASDTMSNDCYDMLDMFSSQSLRRQPTQPGTCTRMDPFPSSRTETSESISEGKGRKLPLLDLVTEEGGDFLDERTPTADKISSNRLPIYIPPLRLRPAPREKEMPSPLARRGAAERAYLQGQLRAEARLRKKQQQQNEERKRKEFSYNIDKKLNEANSEKDAMFEDGVQSMIDKFDAGFKTIENATTEMFRNGCKPYDPKSMQNRQAVRDSTATPPAILKETRRRTVSAVLAESRSNDGDSFVLYFPDGVKILDDSQHSFMIEGSEENENSSQTNNNVFPFLDEQSSREANLRGSSNSDDFDLRNGDLRHELDSDFNLTRSSSTTSIVDLLGSMQIISRRHSTPWSEESPDEEQSNRESKGKKKVLLRPKTVRLNKVQNANETELNVPAKDSMRIKGTDSQNNQRCSSEAERSVQPSLASDTNSNSAKNIASPMTERAFYPHQEKFSSLELMKTSTKNDGPTINFSSPEPTKISRNHWVFSKTLKRNDSTASDDSGNISLLKEPLSESNYHTPDHTHDSKFQRKRFGPSMFGAGSGRKMATLSELCLPALGEPVNLPQQRKSNLDSTISKQFPTFSRSRYATQQNENTTSRRNSLPDKIIEFEPLNFSLRDEKVGLHRFENASLSCVTPVDLASIPVESLTTPC